MKFDQFCFFLFFFTWDIDVFVNLFSPVWSGQGSAGRKVMSNMSVHQSPATLESKGDGRLPLTSNLINIIPIYSNTDTLWWWLTRPTIPKCQCLMSWEWDSKINFHTNFTFMSVWGAVSHWFKCCKTLLQSGPLTKEFVFVINYKWGSLFLNFIFGCAEYIQMSKVETDNIPCPGIFQVVWLLALLLRRQLDRFTFPQSSSYEHGSLFILLVYNEDVKVDRNGARLPAWLDQPVSLHFPRRFHARW